MSGTYIWRRIGYGLITLFIIVTLNFVIFRIMPGDPMSLVLSPDFTPEMRQLLLEKYGLDQPLPTQYVLYLKSMLTFDFGRSFYNRQPVLEELLARLPNTLMLLGTAFVLNVFIGVTLGLRMATKQGTRLEAAVTGVSLFLNAMPGFFIGLLLLLAFGYYWPIFPIRGTMSVPPPTEFWDIVLDRIHHFILPVAAVTLSGYGSWYLYTRNNVIGALESGLRAHRPGQGPARAGRLVPARVSQRPAAHRDAGVFVPARADYRRGHHGDRFSRCTASGGT